MDQKLPHESIIMIRFDGAAEDEDGRRETGRYWERWPDNTYRYILTGSQPVVMMTLEQTGLGS
ncbi:hypothetical protein Tdes44962_MAKER06689 [Teratosphaeria destructans]|uniref:Uncharacterized protein n=1 Tax=Teratosphaeria destructans TaxID=418781 RepID=A0A9W7W6U2_9PEZI|nr:hypothetical protein Tdes44962_MAKER06689 [Teratosphaeria destructans]